MFRTLLKEKLIRNEKGSGGANLPELLSPAGTPECARAAILNGADAVYLGLKEGSARAGAGNFDFEELAETCRFAHVRGVKVYVALNTLAFGQAELDMYFQNAFKAAQEGADGIIVQDTGLVTLLSKARSNGQLRRAFRISASTQLGICSAAGLRTMKQLGVSRVILPRELTLEEIAELTEEAHRLGLETEVFCHGAMCVCYSGSCLLSSFSGGRSGNRGECAQPCRMKYLVRRTDRSCVQINAGSDSAAKPCRPNKYAPAAEIPACHLSPDDLLALPLLDKLLKTGVDSIKIEGRLKAPEYTAAVTRAYRIGLDACAAGTFHEYKHSELPSALTALRTVFTRDGGHPGFLNGAPDKSHITYLTPGRKGLYLGTVNSGPEHAALSAAKAKGLSFFRVNISLSAPVSDVELTSGMGITLRDGSGNETGGGTVNSVLSAGSGRLELLVCGSFDHRAADPGNSSGLSVYLTEDPDLMREIRDTYKADAEPVKLPLSLEFEAASGSCARLTVSDYAGHTVTVQSDAPLPRGEKAPLTEASVQKNLEKLGNVPFYAKNTQILLKSDPFMPVSAINAMRRNALAELMKIREAPVDAGRIIDAPSPVPASPSAPPASVTHRNAPALSGYSFWFYRAESFFNPANWPEGILPAVCYVPAQAWVLEDIGTKLGILRRKLELLHPEAPEWAKKFKIIAALPPLSFPEDIKIIDEAKHRISMFADGVQLQNPGDLADAAETYRIDPTREFLLCADSSLNVSNPESARLLAAFGIDVITLSPEPDQSMLLKEIQSAGTGTVTERIIRGPMPLMRMRRCIVSSGTPNCRACDKADFRLAGQKGFGYDILTLPRNRGGEPGICQNLLLSDCAFCERSGTDDPGRQPEPAPGTLLQIRIK